MASNDDTGQGLMPDPAIMRAGLDVLTVPGEPFELRVLKSRYGGPMRFKTGKTYSGYFTSVDDAVKAAQGITGRDCAGVYLTINELAPYVLNWGAGRIAEAEKTTADGDVFRYRHLYFDFDPVRPALTNATADERDAAVKRAGMAAAYLHDEGFPGPVWAGRSGSGAMGLYRIDLPVEDKPLVERFMTVLSDRFSDDTVKLDAGVFNPARIVRLPGTVNAKSPTPGADRPWRLATGRAFADAGVIARDLLVAIAGPERPASKGPVLPANAGDGFDLGAVLRDSGIDVKRTHTTSYGATVYDVDCLTSGDHDDGACFMQFPSGAWTYRCLHDRCSGKGNDYVRGFLKLPERSQATLRSSKTSQTPQRATGHATAPRAAVIVRLSDVESKPVDWLWGGWLPRRMLTILGGYSGDGKSTTTLALAATFSRGGNLPDGTRARRIATLILAAEDDAEYAIRPRLDLHGADPSRVLQLKATRREDGREAWLDLRTDTDVMRDVIAREGIGLVLIDPLSSYMPKADRNDEGSVRDALAPLQALMEDTGVAVLGVMHIGKGDAGRKSFQRLIGSTAFTALARSVWMIHDLPDDEQPVGVEDDPSLKRKVLGVTKANYAIPPQSLAFSRPLDGPVIWHGPSPVSIEAAIAGTTGEKKLDEAQDFLRDFLKGGARHASEAFAAAKANDITERTLKRAKAALKVVAFKEPGKKAGGWLWRLPAASGATQDPESEGGQASDVGTLPETGPDSEECQESLYRQVGTLHDFPNGSTDEDDELMPTGTDGEWEYVL